MKRTLTVLAAMGLVASLALVGPLGAKSGNKYANETITFDCGDGDEVVYNGPAKLWPPNHKFVTSPVTATDGDGTSGVTLDLSDTQVEDIAGGDGGTNHDPDVAFDPETGVNSGDGSTTVDLSLRSERSGKGEGRTYTVNWIAMFDDNTKDCSSMDADQEPIVVFVPHDMRGGADWK